MTRGQPPLRHDLGCHTEQWLVKNTRRMFGIVTASRAQFYQRVKGQKTYSHIFIQIKDLAQAVCHA